MADKIRIRIQVIRKKLSYMQVFTDCWKIRRYTKHQKNIKYRMGKQYGRITTQKLQYLNAQLKQELKVESIKLRNKKKIQERGNVNRMFRLTSKKVYRSMKGESTEPVKEMPTKEETQTFWMSLWGEPVQHNQDAP